jgi:hypothetical protein
MEKVNLSEKFRLFQEHWSPKIVGEVNDCYLKLVKFKGRVCLASSRHGRRDVYGDQGTVCHEAEG